MTLVLIYFVKVPENQGVEGLNTFQEYVQKLPAEFDWFFYSLAGVFGFETLLKNFNVKFGSIGLINLSDWLEKAKVNAAASVIRSEITKLESEKTKVVKALRDKLSKEELLVYIKFIFPEDQVKRIEAKIEDEKDWVAILYLSLAFVEKDFNQAKAVSKLNTDHTGATA